VPSGLTGVPAQIRAAISAHARNCHPEECCGLLAFDGSGRLSFAYALTNEDHSPVAFTVSPEESYHAFLHAENQGWTIAGDFHSHPRGPDTLSPRDLESAVPGWLHVLLSPAGLTAWRIENGSPVSVEIGPNDRR
jgi:proteasome lid subunit RPN8/RPN11